MDVSQVSCLCLGWWLEGKDGASAVVPEERALKGLGRCSSVDLTACSSYGHSRADSQGLVSPLSVAHCGPFVFLVPL